MSVIGDNIKALRREAGMTQRELAEKLNVSFQAVSKYENEGVMPDVMSLPEIAKIFGVTIDDLFKDNMSSYRNKAERLLAVYERTANNEDFIIADREFENLNNEEMGLEDKRNYAKLYHLMTYYSMCKGLKLIDEVVEQSQDDLEELVVSLCNKSNFLSMLGRKDITIEVLEAMQSQYVENSFVLQGLLHSYKNADMYDKVIQVFEENKENCDAMSYLYAGDSYARMKQYDKALDCWSKSIEMDDKYSDALYSIALYYKDIGCKDKEKEAWNQVLMWLEKKELSYSETEIFVRKQMEEC